MAWGMDTIGNPTGVILDWNDDLDVPKMRETGVDSGRGGFVRHGSLPVVQRGICPERDCGCTGPTRTDSRGFAGCAAIIGD